MSRPPLLCEEGNVFSSAINLQDDFQVFSGAGGIPGLMEFLQSENTFKESAGFKLRQYPQSFFKVGCCASDGSDDGLVVAHHGLETKVSLCIRQTEQKYRRS